MIELNMPNYTHTITLVDGLSFHLTDKQKIPNMFHRFMLKVVFGIKVEILK